MAASTARGSRLCLLVQQSLTPRARMHRLCRVICVHHQVPVAECGDTCSRMYTYKTCVEALPLKAIAQHSCCKQIPFCGVHPKLCRFAQALCQSRIESRTPPVPRLLCSQQVKSALKTAAAVSVVEGHSRPGRQHRRTYPLAQLNSSTSSSARKHVATCVAPFMHACCCHRAYEATAMHTAM